MLKQSPTPWTSSLRASASTLATARRRLLRRSSKVQLRYLFHRESNANPFDDSNANDCRTSAVVFACISAANTPGSFWCSCASLLSNAGMKAMLPFL